MVDSKRRPAGQANVPVAVEVQICTALQGVDLRFDRRGYHFRWPVVAALRLPHCARAPSRRLFGAIPCHVWLVVVAAAALSNDVRNALSPTFLIRMRSVRSHAALCGRAGGFTAAGCGRAARPRRECTEVCHGALASHRCRCLRFRCWIGSELRGQQLADLQRGRRPRAVMADCECLLRHSREGCWPAGLANVPVAVEVQIRTALQGVDLRFDRRGYHFRWPVVAALRLPHCARAPSRRLFGAIPCHVWLVVVAAAALSNDVRNALSPTFLIRMRSVRSHAALCGRAGGFTAAGCGRAARPRRECTEVCHGALASHRCRCLRFRCWIGSELRGQQLADLQRGRRPRAVMADCECLLRHSRERGRHERPQCARAWWFSDIFSFRPSSFRARKALTPTGVSRVRSIVRHVRSHDTLCGRPGGVTAAGCGVDAELRVKQLADLHRRGRQRGRRPRTVMADRDRLFHYTRERGWHELCAATIDARLCTRTRRLPGDLRRRARGIRCSRWPQSVGLVAERSVDVELPLSRHLRVICHETHRARLIPVALFGQSGES